MNCFAHFFPIGGREFWRFTHTLRPAKFKSYSKYVLQLYPDNDNTDEEEGHNRECVSFFQLFSSKRILGAHYRGNKDSDIIYMVDKLTPEPFPNVKFITRWGNGEELQKLLIYRRRLTINEEEYYHPADNNGYIKRGIIAKLGYPISH